jgi:hypothetical protein
MDTITNLTGHGIKRDMTDQKGDLLKNSKEFTSPPIKVEKLY